MVQLNNDFLSVFSPNEQLVMLVLLLNSKEGGKTNYSDRYISRVTGVSYQQVRTIHKNLLKRGVINAVVNADGNSKSTHVTICSNDCYDICQRNVNAEDNALLNAEIERLRLEVDGLKGENVRLKEELANAGKKKRTKDKKDVLGDASAYSERYIKFLEYLEKETPYCYKNMTLPTEVQFYTLVEQYGARMVADIVKQIENRKDLRKTYTNLYMTMTNWLKNEVKRNNGTAI